MTAPGDATAVGAIVAYLRMNRDQWRRDVDETKRDARQLGATNPDIRISTNAGEAIAQLKAVQAAQDRTEKSGHSLVAAIAAVAPAAIPIAAVAGGAFLGLVPVLATVALGIAGIRDEAKSGQLAMGPYGNDIRQLDHWFGNLKQTAAGGILAGVDQAIQNSRPLFRSITQDVGGFSAQIGQIIAHGAPALLAILHDLEPLFATIGNYVEKGAAGLEHWAKSSGGISHFVTYVQAELPTVIHFIGELATFISHLVQSGTGVGGALLTDFTLLIHVLNQIPISVLSTAIPLAISLYAALKTGAAVTAIVKAVNGAVLTLGNTLGLTGPKAAAAAAVTNAALLSEQATAAETAATFAAAEAAKATAAAESATEIAAALEGTDSILAGEATAAAEASIEFAAAMQAEAGAAVATATIIAAAAGEAAEASTTAGAVAATGWSSMLGPLAAVGIGIVLLTTLFGSNKDATEANIAAQNAYASSLRESTDLLSTANLQATIKNLQDQKAPALIQAVANANNGLKVSLADASVAVNGTKGDFDGLYNSLINVAQHDLGRWSGDIKSQLATGPNSAGDGLQILENHLGSTGKSAVQLAVIIRTLRDGLSSEQKAAIAAAEAQRKIQQALDGGKTAAAGQARALGLMPSAFLDAEIAAKKNTAQTKAQTAAFQLENDAAGLVNQALATMAGQNLDVAQAHTAFHQSVNALVDALKKSKGEIKGNSDAQLAARAGAQSAVAQARQIAEAVAKQTHSNDQAAASYRQSKRALLDELEAHNRLTPAVQRYVDKLFETRKISDYLSSHPTKLDVRTEKAIAAVNDITGRFAALSKLDPTVHVYASTDGAVAAIQRFVKTPWTTYVQVQTVGGSGPASGGHTLDDVHRAAGGPITGPGPKGVDSVHMEGAPGEWVITDDAVDAITRAYGSGAMASINRGVLPTAAPASAVRGSAPHAAASGAQGVGAGDVAAAIHGARVVLDVPGVGRLNAHIDTRASRVARAELDADSEYRSTLAGMSG